MNKKYKYFILKSEVHSQIRKRRVSTELKSCPFCGCVPIVKSFDMYGEKWFYIMCPACRAEINEPVPSEKEAAQAWNRRSWAKENPEPEYPTWIDWLIQQGIVPNSDDVINSTDPGIRAASFFVTSKAFERIPEDIAKVLIKNAQSGGIK